MNFFVLFFVFILQMTSLFSCCSGSASVYALDSGADAYAQGNTSSKKTREMRYSPVVSKILNTETLQGTYSFSPESAVFFMFIKGTDYHSLVDKAIDETGEFRIAVGAKLEKESRGLDVLSEYKKASNQEEILRAFQNLLQSRFSLLNQILPIASGITPYGEFAHHFPNADSVKNHFLSKLIELLDEQLSEKMPPLLKEEFATTATWVFILGAFSKEKKQEHHDDLLSNEEEEHLAVKDSSCCLPTWWPFRF